MPQGCSSVVGPVALQIIQHHTARAFCKLTRACEAAGHTASWGKGYPELLTQCYDEQGHPNGQLGPLDPTQNATYTALWLLLREATQVFPDTYLHLGGDEVPFDCWQVCNLLPCVCNLLPDVCNLLPDLCNLLPNVCNLLPDVCDLFPNVCNLLPYALVYVLPTVQSPITCFFLSKRTTAAMLA